ncbi:MAG: hypothetical protein KatS3mg124_0112 [Porticoccaceae bacterium]|nr:MAG: hypothetical protein KatS3mg124_0112 [Porticoccaceae bacterium]
MAVEGGTLIAHWLALRGRLMRMLVRLVPPREVEDIVQETYVRLCQLERRGEPIVHPRALLLRTARNLALDYLKRAETRLADSLESLAAEPAGEGDATLEGACGEELFGRLCGAVRQLPPQCRRAFVLRKVHGLSQREIAARLGIAESTVEKHLAEGLRRLVASLAVTPARRAGRRRRDHG